MIFEKVFLRTFVFCVVQAAGMVSPPVTSKAIETGCWLEFKPEIVYKSFSPIAFNDKIVQK